MYNCFNSFWIRRLDESTTSPPWFISDIEYTKIRPPTQLLKTKHQSTDIDRNYLNISISRRTANHRDVIELYVKQQELINNNQHADDHQITMAMDSQSGTTGEDMRAMVRLKAQQHHGYYRQLYTGEEGEGTTTQPEMAVPVPFHPDIPNTIEDTTEGGKTISSASSDTDSTKLVRQRRTGVFEMSADHSEDTIFKSVKDMKERYQLMVEETTKQLMTTDVKTGKDTLTVRGEKHRRRGSTDDSFLVPPPSGYCSSSASGTSDDERQDRPSDWKQRREQNARTSTPVQRSGSTDSAVGPSDDEVMCTGEWSDDVVSGDVKTSTHNDSTRVVQSACNSPYSPRGSVDHVNVPSKMLIEAQCVPYTVMAAAVSSSATSAVSGMAVGDRKMSDCASEEGDVVKSDSRRQSCFTDDGDEVTKYRYWRTPSVVVSDYSDDIIGLTLDDIEYFRNQRKEFSSSPDSSLHSSCSNLNYCGSTISTLDTEFTRHPFRKQSASSICSLSGDEECDHVDNHLQPLNTEKPSAWRKLRNIVHWTPFFQTYKKQRYPWVQLAGHQGNFKAGPDQGTILKKLCEKEEKCFKVLMKDVLRPYVPEYKGLVTSDDGECSYLQLQDLLGDFVSPCVMDCKIGVRTYLEEELAKAKEKPKLRKDMYEKMCQIDSSAPTEEEHRLKGVTKPRYMVWRETISSTETLGFRIEGIRRGDGTSSKDFKTTKSRDQVMQAFADFTEGFPHALPKYIQRLKAIKATLESSKFFQSHEVIGSSLLFVHDRCNANVWLIDFAKTILLPDEVDIDHNSKWKVGNHEDGYLIGVNNLISIFVTVLEKQPVVAVTPPLSQPDGKENKKSTENITT